jgi:hypothetical protein
MVENEPLSNPREIREMVKKFVLNNGAVPNLSDSPKKAIVSIKTNRGTSYEKFIEVYNEVQGAYYDMYAARAGVTNEKWREIASKTNDPDNKRIYDEARMNFPMQISIAEPNKSSN